MVTIGITQVSGQSLKDLVKKRGDDSKETTEEKGENRTETAVRKGVNKGLDKIFGTSSAEEDEGEAVEETEDYDSDYSDDTDYSSNSRNSGAAGIGRNAIMSGLGLTGTANVKDSYNFDAFIEMTIVNYDASGEVSESGKYISYVDAETPDYGLAFTDDEQKGEMLMIFDTENGQMLTLMEQDGEKTGFVVAFDEETMKEMEQEYDEAEEEELEEVETNPYNIKKTGKTKKILGYNCEEYTTEDENSIVSMWVTDDLGKKVDKTFMRNSNFSGLFLYAYYTNGFIMEYDIEEKDDHERSVMTVTDIDIDNVTSIKTGGYTIMNMGAMQKMMEEEEEAE